MATAENNVKKAAELKLWLEGRIAELQAEIEKLQETLGYVDTTLRASTYRPAIDMLEEGKEVPEIRELKRDKGGELIATASVTSDSLTVEPKEGVSLRPTTPPFKSFLITKILQGMREKDEELVAAGRLAKGMELRFDLEEANGLVAKLTVENYREKARLNEIISTITWTFSRMLEK